MFNIKPEKRKLVYQTDIRNGETWDIPVDHSLIESIDVIFTMTDTNKLSHKIDLTINEFFSGVRRHMIHFANVGTSRAIDAWLDVRQTTLYLLAYPPNQGVDWTEQRISKVIITLK